MHSRQSGNSCLRRSARRSARRRASAGTPAVFGGGSRARSHGWIRRGSPGGRRLCRPRGAPPRRCEPVHGTEVGVGSLARPVRPHPGTCRARPSYVEMLPRCPRCSWPRTGSPASSSALAFGRSRRDARGVPRGQPLALRHGMPVRSRIYAHVTRSSRYAAARRAQRFMPPTTGPFATRPRWAALRKPAWVR